ncbi:MAG: SPFH domain-containing protein [Nitrospirae bacterium]|nr:SPFH domain-containing protein [Nitrospirota bacterium]
MAGLISLIVLSAFVVVCIVTLLLSWFIVRQQTAAIIERFGKYNRVANAGLNFKVPYIESIVKIIDLRTHQLDIDMETKTKDNVFVRLVLSVQYLVKKDRVSDAYYKLTNHEEQIKSYVYNEVRAHIPKMNLDEAYEGNEEIAGSVANKLKESMADYGYEIMAVLVRDIDPDRKVKDSMNEINAAQRFQAAASARGEGEKTLIVKKAEAEAESKKLQGEGIANERKAIISGLQESLDLFQKGVPGSTARDAMELVLLTQYFDTLKDIGAQSKSNIIFVPHSPGAISDLSSQIRDSILAASTLKSDAAP